MSSEAQSKAAPKRARAALGLVVGAVALAVALEPGLALATARFVLAGLLEVAPFVVPGIVLAAWLVASGASRQVAAALQGRVVYAVLAASAVGALTPVCGVTVLPLMVGFLAAGVPLAPVMAFWLSSPITDPAMLAATAATLGLGFAVGKTLAAFGLGLLGGGGVALLSHRSWVQMPLRRTVPALSSPRPCGADDRFRPAIWRESGARGSFLRECLAVARLMVLCLVPAFAAEYLLGALLDPGALTASLGGGAWWAIPAAVFVGAPAYLDGYAALPLTRALLDHGMSSGAAMAFLVSGGVVSIWGALAIAPVLRAKAFLLYLVLALGGSLLAGWLFEAIA